MSPVYCALVHHPVADRTGDEVTTSVTNLDVHDIARAARTYGLRGYFVVSPIEAQRPVVQRILDHWCEGSGKTRVPERADALALVEIARSVDEAIARIIVKEGQEPRLVMTSARAGEGRRSYAREALQLADGAQPTLILFGTGHGLGASLLQRADAILAPIEGPTAYNHLSVRAAAAITFDRLLSRQSQPNDGI